MNFYSLRNFLTPIWKYAYDEKAKGNGDVNLNNLILHALDNQLKTTESETIASKADLYLKTARAEYLDYFGSWIGLERLNKDESDDHYRKRLINHILHARNTIPAIRKAVSSYLHTHMDNVHIYEPWQDAFLTNDFASRTNSRTHLYGYYYRPAIINIIIDTPFDEGVVDYINWFRPAGVIYLITYENNGPEAPIWDMPGVGEPTWQYNLLHLYMGFERENQYTFNFLDPNSSYGDNPFYLSGLKSMAQKANMITYNETVPLSDLNSDDVLMNDEYFGKQYYSYLSALHGLLRVYQNDDISSLLLKSYIINPDLYPRMNEDKGLLVNITHRFQMANMFSHTLDFYSNWKTNDKSYMSGLAHQGKAVILMTDVGATVTDTESQFQGVRPLPNGQFVIKYMQPNQKYYLGFWAKSSNGSGNVRFKVRVNENQTLTFDNNVNDKNWTYFQKSFIYDGSRLMPVTFTLLDKPYDSGDILFSSPMLSDKDWVWTPSKRDLQSPELNNNSQFIYGFLNIREFFYHNVMDQNTLYTYLRQRGISPTPQVINQFISNYFNQKLLTISYEPLTKQSINTRFWIKDFKHNQWLNFDTHLNVKGHQNDIYKFTFGDLSTFLNQQGLMITALQVPAFNNDYEIKLHALGFRFEQLMPNFAGIQIYDPNNDFWYWLNLTLHYGINWTEQDDKNPYRSRVQRYHPIRYIRNWIKDVTYGDTVNHGFITNDSALNGERLLNYFQSYSSNTYLPPYIADYIIPSLTPNGNPVKSVSILGVTTGDNYPSNQLNNLLKNSVFGYFTPHIWDKSKDYSLYANGNVEKIKFKHHNDYLATSTESIGSRNIYALSFAAKAQKPTKLTVKVLLHSNSYTQTLSQSINVDTDYEDFKVRFNTYGVYPDKVTFVWSYQGYKADQIIFKNLSCHLDVKVSVDGHNVNKFAPQINFFGDNTLKYNDIVFGQPINPDLLGERYGDLEKYKNTWADFEHYGYTYEFLRTHVVLGKSLTWNQLGKKHITWDYMKNHKWLWIPALNGDDIPDQIKEIMDYSHDNYTFNQINHPQYTFKYANNHDWLFEDGDGFDLGEHCVTIDLGRTYTNINHILVQHGSDSVPNAIYDSCIQTSIDGKHWDTWYDNYRGDKQNLDKPYVEPVGKPAAIPIDKYDCANDKFDFRKPLNDRNYVSDQVCHWPTRNLSALLFNDTRNHVRISDGIYTQSKDILSPFIPSLKQAKRYSSNIIRTPINLMDNLDPLANSNTALDILSERPIKPSNKANNWKQYAQPASVTEPNFNTPMEDNGIIPQGVSPASEFYLNSLYSRLNGNRDIVNNGIQFKRMIYHHLPKQKQPQNNTDVNNKAKHKIINSTVYQYLILNDTNTRLNSKALLQYGVKALIIHHRAGHAKDYSGTIPNPPISTTGYDMRLIHFNLLQSIKTQYPDIDKRIKEQGITDIHKFLLGLIEFYTTLHIITDVQTNNTWSMSLWDYNKDSWQHTKVNPLNGEGELAVKNFKNCLDNNGNLYMLIVANDNSKKSNLSISDILLYLNMNLAGINTYLGGMYPHINYELNNMTVYHLKPTGGTDVMKLPYLSSKIKGHKITFSFNIHTSSSGGEFRVKIDKAKSGLTPLEKGFQNFRFTFDIGNNVKVGNGVVPELIFYNNLSNIQVYGVKAEIGIKETPYTSLTLPN